MARPKPNIIKTVELGDGSTWDILNAESHYVITYQGKTCGVRQHNDIFANKGFKYQKLSYTSLGSAQAQVRRLNHKFDTEDFDVMEVSVE